MVRRSDRLWYLRGGDPVAYHVSWNEDTTRGWPEEAPKEPAEALAKGALLAAIPALGLTARNAPGTDCALMAVVPEGLPAGALATEGLGAFAANPRLVWLDYHGDNACLAGVLALVGRLGRCLTKAGYEPDTTTALDLVVEIYRNREAERGKAQ